jgi:hypothetical protein
MRFLIFAEMKLNLLALASKLCLGSHLEFSDELPVDIIATDGSRFTLQAVKLDCIPIISAKLRFNPERIYKLDHISSSLVSKLVCYCENRDSFSTKKSHRMSYSSWQLLQTPWVCPH